MKINLQYRNTNFLISLDHASSIKVEELKLRFVNTLKEIIKNKELILKSSISTSRNNISNTVVNNSTGIISSKSFSFKLSNVLVNFSRNFEDFFKEIDTLSKDTNLIKLFNTNNNYENTLINNNSDENSNNNIISNEKKLISFKELENCEYLKQDLKITNNNLELLEKTYSSKSSLNSNYNTNNKNIIYLKVVACNSNSNSNKLKEKLIKIEESNNVYESINPINSYEYNTENKSIENLITYCTGATTPLKEFKINNNNNIYNSGSSSFGSNINNNDLINALMSLRNHGQNNDVNRPSTNEILNRILMPLINNVESDSSNNSSMFNSQSSNNSNVRVVVNHSGENNLNSHSGMNNIFSNFMHGRSVVNESRPPVVPNPDMINQLVEMGFEEPRARRALIATRNNIEAAVEMIASDGDLGLDDGNNNSNNNIISSVNNNNINYDIEMYDDEDYVDELDNENNSVINNMLLDGSMNSSLNLNNSSTNNNSSNANANNNNSVNNNNLNNNNNNSGNN